MLKQVCVSALGVALVSAPAVAQRIASRADLVALLLPGATTETFNAIPVAAGGAFYLPDAMLDASTVVPGGGPGLVGGGLRVTGVGGTLQVNGPGYYGSATQSLSGGSPGGHGGAETRRIALSFLDPTTAFGLDAFQFDCCGVGEGATASVFGAGDVLLGTIAFTTPAGPAATFVGWQFAGGIARVELLSAPDAGVSWSPLIDDVTFGNVSTATTAPEPATLGLLGAGLLAVGALARRRRRIA